jgi:hypothetical protein
MLADADGSNARFGERRAAQPDSTSQAIATAVELGDGLGKALR